MHMNRYLLAMGLLALPPALVQACPKQVPPGLKATAVAEDAVVNGLPVSSVQVTAAGAASEVLTRVEKQWKADGYQVKRSAAAGWNVVSALSENCMTTLQLNDRGGAFGYFAYSRLNQIGTRGRQTGVPVPSGAAVTSSVTSNDDGRHGSLTTMTSSQSVDDLRAFYMQRLTEEKWGAVRADEVADASGQVHSVIVSAQRGRERVDVVIWRDQQTQVVVNVAATL
jgi:hypothetical protein